jgi:hypothetical protein
MAMAAAMRVARRSMRPTSLLDNAARRKGTSACCTSRLARRNLQQLTHRETSSNYLCTNDGLEKWRTPVGRMRWLKCRARVPIGQGYRRNDRGIVGVQAFIAQGVAFVIIHTRVGRAACRYGSPVGAWPPWSLKC